MKYFLILLISIVSFQSKAQCFDIQSILVDACNGTQEGQNEMVIFKVGSAALNTANLSVSWPNNSWLGICQNAGTAADVAAVNSTIIGCGFLKQPVGGILPANAKVLLISSTAWSNSAQSFVGLSDTLYVIFQCAGNTAGHFANYASGGGLRTLSMSFSVPSGCNDAVTYDRSLLVTQSGTPGGQDGATVEFTPAGAATYVNNGCQAPFTAFSVEAGPNKTVCLGATQNFTATASGAYSNVLWSLGAGATGSFSPSNNLITSYTSGVGDANSIKLYCSITKPCGTQTVTVKDSVTVTVLQQPQPFISASTASLCTSQSATLSYSLSNASSTGTTSVVWLPSNQTSQTISVNAPNIYTVQVTNSCGSKTNTISVTSSPSPTIAISASGATQFCSGGSVVLTANSNTNNYLWSGGITTQTISVSTSTTVVVTTTNACGTAQATQTISVITAPTLTVSPAISSICPGQSTSLQALSNTAVTYTWSGTGITGLNTNMVSVNTAGVYSVSVSNVCGTAGPASATVSVGSSAPTATIVPSSALLCPGQTATLSLIGSTGNYNWSNGATTATTTVSNFGLYSVTITNSCGQVTSTVQIVSMASPTVSVSPATTTLCPGSAITLTATTNTGGFLWNTGAITNTITLSTPGIYTLTVNNFCGSATASVNVINAGAPVLSLSSSSLLICPNETATLTVSGGLGSPAPVYNWSNSTSTGSVVTTNGGTVTVSNTTGCGTGTASIIVNIQNINASISANPASGTKPLVVNFANNSTGASTYFWNFGNGNTANSQSVMPQTYTNSGDYVVYLVVSNGTCKDSTALMIKVWDEEPWLIIPNVFTPNNDTKNDVFKIAGANITDFNCVIFDRWGLKLYSWDDITLGWDGKANGNACTDGTYFYIITAKDFNNKEINKQGSFSLFR